MRRMLLTTAIVLFASNAWAGMICQRIGNQTFCSDNSGNRITCQRIGNQTFCN